MANTQRCKDCFYFDAIAVTTIQTNLPGILESFSRMPGYCRTSPPRVTDEGTKFPVVDGEKDWCREFSRSVADFDHT